MLSLAAAKLELAIRDDITSEDASVLKALRHAVGLARAKTGRYLHCVCDLYTHSSGILTVRAPAHGLAAAEEVRLRGTGLNLDGMHTVVAVPTPHTFTIALADAPTGTATAGTVHPTRAFTFAGNGRPFVWVPQNATPIYELTKLEIWENDAWVEYTEDTDFVKHLDSDGKVMSLETIDNLTRFPLPINYAPGTFGRVFVATDHTVRVTVRLGMTNLAADLEMAICSLMAELYEREGTARDLASVSVGGASRTAYTGPEKFEQRFSPDNVFLNWKATI